jgi:hypothetical protein
MSITSGRLRQRGNGIQFAEREARHQGGRAFVDELTDWIRFNQKEALATLDGLYSPCSDRFGYQVGISESTDRSSNSTQAISKCDRFGQYTPQLLIRFGYGKSMPQSLRRPVEQVLV